MSDAAGEILRRGRERKGISRERLSKQTAIRESILEALESGNFAILPAPYVASFIKKYAESVGLSESETSQVMGAIATAAPKVAAEQKSYRPLETASRGVSVATSWIPKLLYAGIAVAIAASGYYFVFVKPTTGGVDSLNAAVPGAPPAAEQTVQIKPAPGVLPAVDSQATRGTEEGSENDSLMLDIIATERAWVSINLDGSVSRDLLLEKGEQRSFSAGKFIKLSLGNAGGQKFILNGEELEPFGQRGKIIRDIKISKSLISASNKPSIVIGEKKAEILRNTPAKPATPPPTDSAKN